MAGNPSTSNEQAASEKCFTGKKLRFSGKNWQEVESGIKCRMQKGKYY